MSDIDRKTLSPLSLAGIAWRGTYQEAVAGDLQKIIAGFCDQLPNSLQDKPIYGVTTEQFSGGFGYFIGLEASASELTVADKSTYDVPQTNILQLRCAAQTDAATNGYRRLMDHAEEQELTHPNPPFIHCDIYPTPAAIKGDGEIDIMIPVSG